MPYHQPFGHSHSTKAQNHGPYLQTHKIYLEKSATANVIKDSKDEAPETTPGGGEEEDAFVVEENQTIMPDSGSITTSLRQVGMKTEPRRSKIRGLKHKKRATQTQRHR
jgi:hypothetical protein